MYELSIAEVGRLLRAGTLTSMELTQDALSRIDSLNPLLGAFLLVTEKRALEDALRADREMESGLDRGPMHGIPYALKDTFDTAGVRTTCHSRLQKDHVPAADCAVEGRLRSAGGVMLGKLATHEFACGGPSFDLPFPPARNPWNPEHFPGGSSSGSGVAVAAGIVRMAMGSDTGGSIRGPATYCGTVGFKPTYGRVSRRGVFPLSYTLDHVGPLTWSVEDAALSMQVIAGHDPTDPASADIPVPRYSAGLDQGVAGMRIGYPRSFFATAEGVSEEVVQSMDASANRLATLGADVEEVTLPSFDLFNACGQVIMQSEAYAIHEENLRVRPLDYGRYTYQRIALGALLSAADLTQALRLRRELVTSFNSGVLHGRDAIITAAALTPAPRFDEFPPDISLKVSTHSMAFNVTGNPVLAIPTGFSHNGLPIGMQIVGHPFDESTVLRIGSAFEAATGLIGKRPALLSRVCN